MAPTLALPTTAAGLALAAAPPLALLLLLYSCCSPTALLRRVLSVALCRRELFRLWYSRLAIDHEKDDDIVFMNYGYAPTETALPAAERADQYCANLYLRVLKGVAGGGVAGKRVLEVGAGRGGGASLVARMLGPASVVAVDYSAGAVALARRRHAAVGNLEFREGDAEALPFPDSSFDVVLNVESSHCYGSIDRFFAEVARVLRPGGFFAMCDFRSSAADMAALEAALRAQPSLALVEREDITAGVVRALDEDDERKRRQIAERTGALLRGTMEQFAGLRGGVINESFRARSSFYWRFACRKKAA